MAELFFLFLDFDGLQIFGFEDLPAIETFNVVHPVSAGDDLGARVLTSGLHNSALMKFILPLRKPLSSPPSKPGTDGTFSSFHRVLLR